MPSSTYLWTLLVLIGPTIVASSVTIMPTTQTTSITELTNFTMVSQFHEVSDFEATANVSKANVTSPSDCNFGVSSCKNRCNMPPNRVCSCQHECVIYGNCCEDFVEECTGEVTHPEVTSHFITLPTKQTWSEEKFARMKESRVTCAQNSLLISSCPPNITFCDTITNLDGSVLTSEEIKSR